MVTQEYARFIEDFTKDVSIAFFDCDGTLSVPKYNVNGKYKVGMPASEWLPYNMQCDRVGLNSYHDCEPVKGEKFMYLLDKLKSENVGLNVLTQEYHSYAYFNKVDFITKYFGDYFKPRDIQFCCDAESKIEIMITYAKVHDLLPCEILFVDDRFDLCLKAADAGLTVLHTSYFV